MVFRLRSESNGNEILSLSWSKVNSFRLGRHHLATRAPLESLITVVRDTCGVQAQLMSAAQIALWTRVQNLKPEDVERALWRERTLVKTWCMRGAAHLLPAKDLPVYVSALRRSAIRDEQRWIARHGVSPTEAEAMTYAVVEALAEGPLTRRELTEQVVARLGVKVKRWIEHSWGGVVKQVCLKGLACFGPNRGREITFVRLDRWLPDLKDLPVEEAECYLLRRYLQSNGPATSRDFAKWTGMKVKDASLIRERLGDEVVEISIEGRKGLILHKDLAVIQEMKARDKIVRLLPSFDSYMLAHKDKGHLVDEVNYKQVYRKAGWLSPVVLVDGRVIGTWSYQRRGRLLYLTVESFDEMSRVVRNKVEAEAVDLGRFLGAHCEVTISRKEEHAQLC